MGGFGDFCGDKCGNPEEMTNLPKTVQKWIGTLIRKIYGNPGKFPAVFGPLTIRACKVSKTKQKLLSREKMADTLWY